MQRTQFFALAALITLMACSKSDDTPTGVPSGKVEFAFHHTINGIPLEKNQLVYTNESGNRYMVTDLLYFISDVVFYRNNGDSTPVSKWKDIFYIDESVDSSRNILFYDPVPAGDYDSISFIFGIIAEKNRSFMFVNPPEVLMAWPEVLGGGYHYLMLNGKWQDTSGVLQPFNLHLGIGQLYHGTGQNTDSIYGFVQNYFRVSLPGSGFSMKENETVTFDLEMDVDSWFGSPQPFDLNVYGGAIMQNQAAMQVVRENGKDVFSVRQISTIH